MQQLTPADAERIIATALSRPAGVDLVFGALAELPGVAFAAGQKRGFLRGATAATLRVGDWTFTATGGGNSVEAGHTVRDVILSRTTLSPAEAAAKLAPAVLESARRQGAETEDQAQAVIGALGEVLGL